MSDPAVASLLNIGGLWLLYTTSLYGLMLHHPSLHIFIHLHVFFAGYLFTISIIYIDVTPRRKSYLYRTIVFILALAGHEILSKYIYAYPPVGVPAAEAKVGGMLMYYGGDAVDIILIIILFRQWFKATKPRSAKMAVQTNKPLH